MEKIKYVYLVTPCQTVFSSRIKARKYVAKHFCFNSIENRKWYDWYLDVEGTEVAHINKILLNPTL